MARVVRGNDCVKFSYKRGRNARLLRRMFRTQKGFIVNRKGRLVARWEQVAPQPSAQPMPKVPTKRNR